MDHGDVLPFTTPPPHTTHPKKSNGLMQMAQAGTEGREGEEGGPENPTLEEALDAQVADTQAQHGQLVQFGDDIGGEGQQAGQPIQLCVQPVPVPLGRVGLLVGRGRFPVKAVHMGSKMRGPEGSCAIYKSDEVSTSFINKFQQVS